MKIKQLKKPVLKKEENKFMTRKDVFDYWEIIDKSTKFNNRALEVIILYNKRQAILSRLTNAVNINKTEMVSKFEQVKRITEEINSYFK